MIFVITITVLSVLVGLCGYALARTQTQMSATAGRSPTQLLSDKINHILPGIQCGQCGHPGCEPYAKAMAEGRAAINLCPPGGEDLVADLAKLLGQEAVAVCADKDAPALTNAVVHDIAWIRARDCIGCTLCLDACPVDAIVGAAEHLHTIVPEKCTGCQLCVAPCPTDCIKMIQPSTHIREWEWPWLDPTRKPPQPR